MSHLKEIDFRVDMRKCRTTDKLKKLTNYNRLRDCSTTWGLNGST